MAGSAADVGQGFRRWIGRAAGVLFVAGGLTNAPTALAHARGTAAFAGVLAVSGVAVIAGIVTLWLPWQRWSARAALWLVPPALAIIGTGNYIDPDPYQAGLFFFVLAMWLGISQPRGTTLALSPLLAFAYWAPIALVPHTPGLLRSVPYLIAICTVTGETMALLMAQLHQAQRQLRQHDERRFQALLTGSSDTTIVLAPDGVVTYASPSSQRVLQIGPAELVGQEIAAIVQRHVHPEDAEQLLARLQRLRELPDRQEIVEFRLRRGDGSSSDVEGRGRNLIGDEAVGGVLLNLRDVSEHRQLERALAHHAFHDQLTGLANRALFDDRLRHAQARSSLLAVVFCDLDDFQRVNDRLGRGAGDRVLIEVARRLSGATRRADTVARLGGDEFALLVEDPGDERELLAFVERLRAVLTAPIGVDGHELLLDVSFGVATAPPRTHRDLLADANLAMYAAKRHGRGGMEVYHERLRRQLVARMELLEDLGGALARGELRVHYQPIVDLAGGEVVGVEALVRWAHPQRGLLGPDTFIAIAEESGLIVPIGRWVLEQACRDVCALSGRLDDLAGLYASVNLSPAQLSSDDLVQQVSAALHDSGLPAQRLVLELTETVLLDPGLATGRRLHALRALGARLAVDDFGAGYSSLRYLRDHPFDILKVDKSFIDQVGAGGNAAELVRSIGQLGQTLGMETIAEGIEHADQATAVRAMGFLRGQGYLFSPPLSLSELTAFLGAVPAPAPATTH